ncbi:helix-turn-helix transcriptional regulator [Pseudogemmobacter bohemicus]|uniref:helix-turn-helix transcriptional regulator n=1 Tax=Pseudogemmobacter bohemicus TaxID=2250708 RepID=UPI0013009D51|nr:helix-turn-helix transcriptional regulator [Pseudogemmobacter bohemicus]
MGDLQADLTDALYAILLREADWPKFLHLLAADLGNGGAQFMLQSDSVNGKSGRIEMSTGVAQKQIDDYTVYFSQLNPWLPDHILRRQDDVIIDHEILPREKLYQTEFYNDYLRPAGYHGSTGLILNRRGGETMFLATIFSNADPETASMVGRRLEGIRPHLKRVMRHYSRLGQEIRPGDFATEALGVLGHGLCIIGDDLKPKLITTTAEEEARRSGLFTLSPTGRLCLTEETARQTLSQMLVRGYTGPTEQIWQQNGCRLTLFRASREPVSELLSGPMAGLIIEPGCHGASATDIAGLQRRHALTAAEMRVLTGISQGLSIRAMAEAHNRSAETIRSQVKSLLHKTGAENQLALLRLLGGQR